MTFKINGKSASSKVINLVRVTPDAHEKIKKLADQHKISMQEVVRQMINYSINNMEEIIHEKK